MSFMSVYNVVSKRADYTRTACGWRAEFRGPFTVRVEAHDLESCRLALLDAANVKVVQWLTGEVPGGATPDSTIAPAQEVRLAPLEGRRKRKVGN